MTPAPIEQMANAAVGWGHFRLCRRPFVIWVNPLGHWRLYLERNNATLEAGSARSTPAAWLAATDALGRWMRGEPKPVA